MNLFTPALIIAGVAGVAYLAVGVAAARYAILGRQQRLRIIDRPSPTVVRLPRFNATESPVTFGLLDEQGRLHVVGAVIKAGDGFIDRAIEADASLRAGERVQLIGNVFGPDSELARSAIPVRSGSNGIVHQVWDVDPPGAVRSLRFVHIHGLGAAPATTLRSVDAASRLGYASTIVSLDGDPDMTRRVDGIRSSAATRVTWAIDHARTLGATRIILVGWSFGAQLASEGSRLRQDVSGLILISPTMDLLRTIALEATTRRVPSIVATAARHMLTTRLLSRLARVDRRFPRKAVPDAAAQPYLLMYSGRDETLRATLPEVAEVQTRGCRALMFPSAPHTMEWNVDPGAFVDAIASWLRSREAETADA